jgi:ankyrin repeat protein
MSVVNLGFLSAAESGNLEHLQFYLSQGADIRTTNPYQEMNALHAAASGNREEIVSYLMQTYPSKTADLINGTDIDGNTPLLKLASKTKISEKIFKLLSSAGAKFDHANKQGLNSLHLLAKNPENVSFLKFALDRIEETGKTAIAETICRVTECIVLPLAQLIASYISEEQKTKALNCQRDLEESDDRPTPLHQAISCKNKKAVALLKDGTDPSLKRTPTSKTLKEELEEFEKLAL